VCRLFLSVVGSFFSSSVMPSGMALNKLSLHSLVKQLLICMVKMPWLSHESWTVGHITEGTEMVSVLGLLLECILMIVFNG